MLLLSEAQLEELLKNEQTCVKLRSNHTVKDTDGNWTSLRFACANAGEPKRVLTPDRRRAPRMTPLCGCGCKFSFGVERAAPGAVVELTHSVNAEHNVLCQERQLYGRMYMNDEELAHLQDVVDSMPYELAVTILQARSLRARGRGAVHPSTEALPRGGHAAGAGGRRRTRRRTRRRSC